MCIFFSLVTAKECMCTFVRLCAEARQTLCSRLDCSTSYVLRQGLSINLYLRSDWLYWLVSELWGIHPSVPPTRSSALRLQKFIQTWLLCTTEDLHAGHRAYVSGITTPETFPQLQYKKSEMNHVII